MSALNPRQLVAGAALGAVVLLTGCQGAAGSSVVSDAEDGKEVAAVGVLELEVGTCLNDVDQPLAQDLTDIPSVSCSEPHQSEVFAEVTIASGEYPGVDEVTAHATTECMSEFRRFVGLDFAASRLNYHFYYPTSSSWALGDRSIYCVVFDPGVETVDSLRGATR